MEPTVNYAGFTKRFLAYWVDFLILFPLGLLFQQLFGMQPFAVFQAESVEQMQQLQQSSANITASLVGLAVTFAFYLTMWVNFDGATPGKKLMAIKITKSDGSKVTYPTAFIRYLGMFVSSIVLCLGYFWIIFDKKKQGWHDKMANTVVVQTGEKSKTGLAVFLALMGFIIYLGYMGAAMAIGFKLGYDSKKNDITPALTLKQNKESLSAEAKVHYDKTQNLFAQLRELQPDIEAMKPVADENIREARKAVELDSENAMLWTNLGHAYSWPNTIGGEEDGLNAYKKAEALDPTNVVLINGVGDALIAMGRYEEAVLQLKKSLRLTDTSGYAFLSIGKAYYALGIANEAQVNLTKAIEVFEKQNDEGQFDDQILEAQKLIANLDK